MMQLRNSRPLLLAGFLLLSARLWTDQDSGQNPQAGTQSPAASSRQPQEPKAPTKEDEGFVFRTKVQEVIVHATVIDRNKRLVTNLDRDAFKVFEDDKLQVITSFRHEDIPVALGIVIDNSGSMRDKRDEVNKAALNLVRASNRLDQVFVVNFNDEYYLDQDFTNDIGKLKEALEKIESRGGTALYDALVASADHLKHSDLHKKILFTVTDGEDDASRESIEKTVKFLEEQNGPTVYAIGILGQEKSRRARRALETIAERTGGIAFMPKTTSEVDEISGTVAHDIRNQYTIGYKPSNPPSNDGYHRIRVEVRAPGHKDLKVRTRTGYFAGEERTAR
jgi:VWFA-related protein